MSLLKVDPEGNCLFRGGAPDFGDFPLSAALEGPLIIGSVLEGHQGDATGSKKSRKT